MRALAVAAIATVLAGTAFAQTGPSFDCGKTSTAIERTICNHAELATADREMAAAYKALVDKLMGPAKEQLQKEQARWISARNQVCSDGAMEMPSCLKYRMESRLANLRALADGPYPDISQQTTIKIGKVRATSFTIDASYPQFDGKSANFVAVNTWFADRTKIAIADHVPDSDESADRQQNWSYQQSYELWDRGRRIGRSSLGQAAGARRRLLGWRQVARHAAQPCDGRSQEAVRGAARIRRRACTRQGGRDAGRPGALHLAG
jgi:uncharacterized protein